jgi:aminopeptidase N
LFPKEPVISPSSTVIDIDEREYQESNSEKSIFKFKLDVPSLPSSIGIVVGDFELYFELNFFFQRNKIKFSQKNFFFQTSLPDFKHPKKITSFCSQGNLSSLYHVSGFISKAFDFFEEFFKVPFPFKLYSQIFVDELLPFPFLSASGISIFSSSILHDFSLLDATIQTRKTLSFALAFQYFGSFITPKDW